MEKIIFATLFTCFLSASSAQTTADYTIFYEFQCIADTVENTHFQPQEFILINIEDESRFMSSGRHYNDSTRMNFRRAHPQPDFSSQEAMQEYANLYQKKRDIKSKGMDFRIIKNFKTGYFTAIIPILTLPLQYLKEPMDFAWEITNERDTILGIACAKAVTDYGGRHYTAWFSPEIPIDDGPYVFRGLPGLILKIEESNGWYSFTVKKIMAKETSRYVNTEWLNEHSQRIDRKTYVDKLMDYKSNPRMPKEVLNFSEERRLSRKKAYEKRFDLLLEQY